MIYNPNMDRDYWRSSDTPKLIEAARDSGHELAIALGERLEQIAPDAMLAEDLQNECGELKRELEGFKDELETLDLALTAAHDEIAELRDLLADQLGCAKP
jgi:archaellum component FlaC